MKGKKALVLALALTMTLGAVGCGGKSGNSGNGGTVTLDDLYIPTYEDNGQQIRMMADCPPDMSDKAKAEQYKAAGFTAVPIVVGAADNKPVDTSENGSFVKSLKVCEEVGLDAFIRQHSKWVEETPAEGAPCYFEQSFTGFDFSQYPAVKGFYFVDEPGIKQLDDLGNRHLTWFNENYGGKGYEFFSNLFACHNPTALAGSLGKSYDDYAETYLDILDKAESVNKHHSVDYYTLRKKVDGTPYMYETNLIAHLDAATRAKAHGVGFSAYLQVFGGNTDGQSYRIPASFADINWNMYNILSFGAHTLKYYDYIAWTNETSMIVDGEPTDIYYWVQEANEYVKKYEHVLLAFNWEHTYTNVGTGSRSASNEAFDLIRDKVKPITDVETVKSKYDITMNEFSDKDGTKAFMLFNYDDPYYLRKNKVQLSFENADGILYYRNGEPTTQVLENGKFEIELEAGEGIFAIPLYKK
ncbi:MAG: hypothetical protein IJZ32_05370 [Clostridia bacterium]|nr:hypothetical protein [Clostridia bacterium]